MSPVPSQAQVSPVGAQVSKDLMLRNIETLLGQGDAEEQIIADIKSVLAKADQLAAALETSQQDLTKVAADSKQLHATVTDMHHKFGMVGDAFGSKFGKSPKENNTPGISQVVPQIPLPRVPLFPICQENNLNRATPQPPPSSTQTSQDTLRNQELSSVEPSKFQTVANQPKSPIQLAAYLTKPGGGNQFAAEVAKSQKDLMQVEVANKKLHEAALAMHGKFGSFKDWCESRTGAKKHQVPNSARRPRANTFPLFSIAEEPDESDTVANQPSLRADAACFIPPPPGLTKQEGDIELESDTVANQPSLRAAAACFIPPPPGLTKQEGDVELESDTVANQPSLRADAACFIPQPPGLTKQW